VLTYKLLWELIQHLQKRNINLKNIKVSHSSTRPCRVCNLCYMLVVGEHELIEVEQQFARSQNVPIIDDVIRVPINQSPKHRPALLAKNLHQWRLIIFVNEIKGIGRNKKVNYNDLYFQLKLHTFRTVFNISVKENRMEELRLEADNPLTQGEKLDVNINHIRVYYFFSEDLNIEKFINETEIKVRITQGQLWNSFLAEGSTKTLHHFKNNVEGGQRHSSECLLFFEDSEYCTVSLCVGLVSDGIYNTEKFCLYKYSNIYFPDENFYNSNPFPDEWMEMFDQNYVYSKFEQQREKPVQQYNPNLSQHELNLMIDFS